jgi:hypothetical protein
VHPLDQSGWSVRIEVGSVNDRIFWAVAIGKVLLRLMDAKTFVRNHDGIQVGYTKDVRSAGPQRIRPAVSERSTTAPQIRGRPIASLENPEGKRRFIRSCAKRENGRRLTGVLTRKERLAS